MTGHGDALIGGAGSGAGAGGYGRAHELYAQWDAAYVLGALSPAERREFETHRAECDRCAAAVADLAAMPGLLSVLLASDAAALLGAEDGVRADTTHGELEAGELPARQQPAAQLPTGLLDRVATRVTRCRRRVWGVTSGVIGLLAGAAAAGLVLPAVMDAPTPPVVAASLQEIVPSPVTASVSMTETSWGTSLEVTCHYGEASTSAYGAGDSGRYALDVTDTAGTTTQVASWSAGSGDTVDAMGSIDTPVARIATVELRSVDSGSVLLSHYFG